MATPTNSSNTILNMLNNNDQFSSHIELARKWYKGKKNLSKASIFLHCLNTANLLRRYYNADFIDSKDYQTLYLTALGHDLFEDTKVDKKEVEKYWGREVVDLINLLTNIRGDSSFTEYIQKLAQSSEEVRLVKLIDILSNLNNSLYRIKKLDKKWLNTFWIPLLDQYNNNLLPSPWKRHQKLASKITLEIQKKILLLKERSSSLS